MKKLILGVVAAACVATSSVADVRTYFGFNVGIGDAPRPPRVYVAGGPDLVVVPGTRVYVVENEPYGYELYRYGGTWYVERNGYWYRAPSYSGPYRVVDVRSVPRVVLTVPADVHPRAHGKRHPHGGPPGQMKKGRG